MTREAGARSGHRARGPDAGPAAPGEPITEMARTHTTVSVERAVLRLAGLDGADAGRHAVGEPAGRRGAGAAPAWSTAWPCPVWHALRPAAMPACADLAEAAAAGTVTFRLPEGDAARTARASRRPFGSPGLRHHRRPAGAAVPHDRGHRRPAQAVDLPDRGDRRHLRGHPAGAGRGAGGRGHHRGHPLHRAVAAGLRARRRDPRGLRRHLRHPGELPADARRARRDLPRAGPLRAADQLRVRACACPRSRPWPGWSAWT